jgi:hypothetical protein
MKRIEIEKKDGVFTILSRGTDEDGYMWSGTYSYGGYRSGGLRTHDFDNIEGLKLYLDGFFKDREKGETNEAK